MGRVYAETTLATPEVSTEVGAEVTWDLTLSRQTQARVDQLAKDIHGTKEDVLSWVLALLNLTVQARKAGKRVAIVDANDNVETEIKLD